MKRFHFPFLLRSNEIENVPRSRLVISSIVFIALLSFLGLILWGTFTTQKNGATTISDMLGENVAINICFACGMLIFIISMVFVVLFYTSTAHIIHDETRCQLVLSKEETFRLRVVSYSTALLLLLHTIFIELISVINVDQLPTPHYAIAICGVVTGVLLHAGLLYRRWVVISLFSEYHKCKFVGTIKDAFEYSERKVWFLLVLNLLVLLSVCVNSIVFTVMKLIDDYVEYHTPVALCEYLLYQGFIFLPFFYILDVYKTIHVADKD